MRNEVMKWSRPVNVIRKGISEGEAVQMLSLGVFVSLNPRQASNLKDTRTFVHSQIPWTKTKQDAFVEQTKIVVTKDRNQISLTHNND